MADPELIRALSDLTLVIRGGLLTTTRDANDSNTYIPFKDEITGTGTFDVWTPVGTRYVLRGYAITAVVKDALAPGATAPGHLYFVDSGTTNAVAPVASYGATGSTTAAQDYVLTGANGPVVMYLGAGIPGSAVGSKLQLDCSNNINAGTIRFSGVVWGTEVPA